MSSGTDSAVGDGPDSVEARLGAAVQGYQSAVDDFDRELARLMGVNETDLRCLEILIAVEETTPRELSRQLGLTTGSVTTMLDRLEKLAYLTRAPHPSDRRKTLIRITPEASRRAYGLIASFLDDAGGGCAPATPPTSWNWSSTTSRSPATSSRSTSNGCGGRPPPTRPGRADASHRGPAAERRRRPDPPGPHEGSSPDLDAQSLQAPDHEVRLPLRLRREA